MLVLLFLVPFSVAFMLTGPSGKPVNVSADSDGVISITASIDTDAFYAQGYVYAKERWWQLEVGRMTIQGRLASILGKGALKDDVFFRSMQLESVSKANFRLLSQRTQNAISAAVDGINAYYAGFTGTFPAEYDVYRIPKVVPQKWTTEQAVAAGVKILAFGLANGMGVQTSTGEILTREGLGDLKPVILETLQPRPFEPSVMGGLNSSAPPQAQKKALPKKIAGVSFEEGALPKLRSIGQLGSKLHFPRASNNWVVSGAHTSTGKPILCNDPHLRFQTPSLWMLMKIYTPQYTAGGVALPLGLPGIVIGSNRDISWGYTNVMSLEQQLFVMQTRKSQGSVQYLYKGQWMNFDMSEETFDIQGSLVNVTQYYSVYGPVLGGIEKQSPADPIISFWWNGLMLNDTAPQAAIEQGYATNHQEWLDSVSKWGSANQNGIFADTSGNIAYHTTGFLHSRKEGDTGLFPLPGDGSMDFFDREIAFEDLPQLLNPERGYIFSANNRILEVGQTNYTEFPQFDGLISGFRAQRIGEMIQGEIDAKRPITVEFMGSIQGDRTTLFKDWLKPTFSLLNQSGLSSEQQARFTALQQWDGNLDLTTVNGPVFHSFWRCLKNASYFELKGASVFWLDIEYIQSYLTSENCGDDWDMRCSEYITQCFQQAANAIPPGTQEGQVHKAVFSHVSPVPPAVASLFDRELPYGGSPDTPFAADDGNTNRAGAGPSYRQIVSMGNRSDDRWIMPMGNSGDPKSPLYDNLLQKWGNVEYLNINL